MKKIIIVLTLFFFGSSFAFAQKAKIKGEFSSKEAAQKAFLNYRNGNQNVSDSVEIKNGKFSFVANISEPTLANLMIRFTPKEGETQPRMERKQVFLEAGNVQIKAKDSLKFAVVSGSKAHTEYEAYKNLMVEYDKQEATFGPRYEKFAKEKDKAGMNSIQKEYQAMMKDKNEKVVKPYIESHPSSPIVVSILNMFVGYDIDLAVAEPLFNNLSAANRNSPSGKSLKERIETSKKTAVGVMAINFTQNDTLGKSVSLTEFRGKYVLIDFWASWCGPCRAENPNVVKAFHDYKDKGFTVLGISLDQPGKHQAWMDAIHKDNLTWTQLSDLKGWKNEVSMMYGISAIPQNLLLDPNGKIIAKNIRGEELPKTLKKLIK